jgi:hypothetical protein
VGMSLQKHSDVSKRFFLLAESCDMLVKRIETKKAMTEIIVSIFNTLHY